MKHTSSLDISPAVIENRCAIPSQTGDQLVTLFSIQKNVPLVENAADGTSPAAVCWNGAIYLFYTSSGSNEIHYIKLATNEYKNGASAESTAMPQPNASNTCKVAVAGTSPNAVVWNETLYLFYTAQSEGQSKKICYTTCTKDEKWTSPQDTTSLFGASNPNAVIWNDSLHIFCANSAGNNILHSSLSAEGNTSTPSWTQAEVLQDASKDNIPIQVGTTPSAVVLRENSNNSLYVFYTHGADSNGYSHIGYINISTKQATLLNETGAQNTFAPNPSALAFLEDLYIFYPSAQRDAVWYTTTADTQTWAPGREAIKPATNTNCCALADEDALFLFWTSGSNIFSVRNDRREISVSISPEKVWTFSGDWALSGEKSGAAKALDVSSKNEDNKSLPCICADDADSLQAYIYTLDKDSKYTYKSATLSVYPSATTPGIRLNEVTSSTPVLYSYPPASQQLLAFKASITKNTFTIVVLNVGYSTNAAAFANTTGLYIGITLNAQLTVGNSSNTVDTSSPDPQITLKPQSSSSGS